MENNTTLKDYSNSTIRPDYSMGDIRRMVNVYIYLMDGKLPEGERLDIQSGNNSSLSEYITMLKCDLESAVRSLSYKERAVLLYCGIDKNEFKECAPFLGEPDKSYSGADVESILKRSLVKIYNFLNN